MLAHWCVRHARMALAYATLATFTAVALVVFGAVSWAQGVPLPPLDAAAETMDPFIDPTTVTVGVSGLASTLATTVVWQLLQLLKNGVPVKLTVSLSEEDRELLRRRDRDLTDPGVPR